MTVQRMTKEGFVDILRKVLPPAYVDGLEADPGGLDIAYAWGAMFELADCALNKGTQAYYLREHSQQTDASAAGQTRATGEFLLTRTSLGAGLGTIPIPAGTLLEAYRIDSYGDEESLGRYRTRVAVTIGQTPITVPVEAELPGYSGNLWAASTLVRFVSLGARDVPSQFIDVIGAVRIHRSVPANQEAFYDVWDDSVVGRCFWLEPDGTPLEELTGYPYVIEAATSSNISPIPAISSGEIGKRCIVHLLDLGSWVSVTQPTAITGGNGGLLDDRAADYGESRLRGETDPELIARLERIDDKISYEAIWRTCDRLLSPKGIAWRLMETGDPSGLGGRVWDLHPWDFGQLAPVESGAEVFGVQAAVWLPKGYLTRFFVVAVAEPIKLETGLAHRVWTETTKAVGAGVGFRLVIDSNL